MQMASHGVVPKTRAKTTPCIMKSENNYGNENMHVYKLQFIESSPRVNSSVVSLYHAVGSHRSCQLPLVFQVQTPVVTFFLLFALILILFITP